MMSIKRQGEGWVQGLAVRWETAVESVLGVVSDKQSVQCEGCHFCHYILFLTFLSLLPFLPLLSYQLLPVEDRNVKARKKTK